MQRSAISRQVLSFTMLFVSVLVSTTGSTTASTTFADELPKVRVTNVRRVFHNGEHNAFTDLIRFQNRFYLTFRSCPDGHMVHPTASIIVLSSEDGKNWKQVHRFRVKHRDTRDPHFLEFKGKLFVYTGTWYSGPTTLPRKDYDLNKHLGYAVWSSDGQHWNSPVMLEGTFGHYIWRASSHGVKAFLCGRRKVEFELSATDYLVAFCLLAVLVISRGNLWGGGNLEFVVQMVIVFYTCELLITEKRRGWNWLSLASMSAGIILGVRGIFLGQ